MDALRQWLLSHIDEKVDLVYVTGAQAQGTVIEVDGDWVELRNAAGKGSICALQGLICASESSPVAAARRPG